MYVPVHCCVKQVVTVGFEAYCLGLALTALVPSLRCSQLVTQSEDVSCVCLYSQPFILAGSINE